MAKAKKKLYDFKDHPEHKAQLGAWAQFWIANALSCKAMDDDDKAKMTTAIHGLYAAAKLEPPKQVIFASGPVSGAISASVAAGVWHLRDNPSEHQKLFGRTVPDDELVAAIGPACKYVLEPESRAATKPDDVTKYLIKCTANWYNMSNGGNQWSAWVSYLSFFKDVAKLDLPEYKDFQHYQDAATYGGVRYMTKHFTIVCDRPLYIKQDERHRPHCETGPYCEFRDGIKLYYVHGVKVPAKVIEAPETYTKAELDAERNSEIHRILATKLGWEKYLSMRDIKTIDSWTDTHTNLTYELMDAKNRLGELEPRYLKMLSPPLNDGTQPYYIEPVDPGLQSAKAARRWQYKACKDPSVKAYRHGDLVIFYCKPEDLEWPSPAFCNANPDIAFVEER